MAQIDNNKIRKIILTSEDASPEVSSIYKKIDNKSTLIYSSGKILHEGVFTTDSGFSPFAFQNEPLRINDTYRNLRVGDVYIKAVRKGLVTISQDDFKTSKKITVDGERISGFNLSEPIQFRIYDSSKEGTIASFGTKTYQHQANTVTLAKVDESIDQLFFNYRNAFTFPADAKIISARLAFGQGKFSASSDVDDATPFSAATIVSLKTLKYEKIIDKSFMFYHRDVSGFILDLLKGEQTPGAQYNFDSMFEFSNIGNAGVIDASGFTISGVSARAMFSHSNIKTFKLKMNILKVDEILANTQIQNLKIYAGNFNGQPNSIQLTNVESISKICENCFALTTVSCDTVVDSNGHLPLHKVLSVDRAFRNCKNLVNATDFNIPTALYLTHIFDGCLKLSNLGLITRDVKNLDFAWRACAALTSFPLIDTSKVTTMVFTWHDCVGLTSFPLIDTGNVTDMYYTWSSSYYKYDKQMNFTSFPAIDTSSVIRMSFTWYGCSKIVEFPLIDTSSVTSMDSTWEDHASGGYGTALITFPAIDTSKVVSMNKTWKGSYNIVNFPTLNLVSCESLNSTWAICGKLKTIILNNSEKVKSLNSTFIECYYLTHNPLSSTISATSMNSTWERCPRLVTLGNLDTQNVVQMSSTWKHCTSIKTFPLIDTSKVELMNSTWNDTGITSFPLIDTKNVLHLQGTWEDCYELTSFPLIEIPKVTELFGTWEDCPRLLSFPVIDTGHIKTFQRTWQVSENASQTALSNNGNVAYDVLTTFTLIDTSSALDLSQVWAGRTGLTSFPLIDTGNCLLFHKTWYLCKGLTSFPLIDMSSATELDGVFVDNRNMVSFPVFNTQNVIKMTDVYRSCDKLTSITLGNVEKVEDFSLLFYRCTRLTEVIATTSNNCKQFFQMFTECFRLKTIPNIDYSKGEKFGDTFRNTGITSLDNFNPSALAYYFVYTFMDTYSLVKAELTLLHPELHLHRLFANSMIKEFSLIGKPIKINEPFSTTTLECIGRLDSSVAVNPTSDCTVFDAIVGTDYTNPNPCSKYKYKVSTAHLGNVTGTAQWWVSQNGYSFQADDLPLHTNFSGRGVGVWSNSYGPGEGVMSHQKFTANFSFNSTVNNGLILDLFLKCGDSYAGWQVDAILVNDGTQTINLAPTPIGLPYRRGDNTVKGLRFGDVNNDLGFNIKNGLNEWVVEVEYHLTIDETTVMYIDGLQLTLFGEEL